MTEMTSSKKKRVIKKIMIVVASAVALIGGIVLGISLYIQSIINSEKFLEIADRSIKDAANFISKQRLMLKYGIIVLSVGLLLLAVTIILFNFVFKKKKVIDQ